MRAAVNQQNLICNLKSYYSKSDTHNTNSHLVHTHSMSCYWTVSVQKVETPLVD